MSKIRWTLWLNPFRWSAESRQSSAGVLVVWGLLVQAFTLPWAHPIGFTIFLTLGATFVAVGVLLYLSTLLFQVPGAASSEPSQSRPEADRPVSAEPPA